MDPADDALLAATRAGDDKALASLLARHAPTVYRFGVRMCRDEEDARDVVQETLLAAARGLRGFRGASSLSTWLFTVARSFCIKKRRTSKLAPKETVSLDDTDAGAPEVRDPGKAPDEVASDRELGGMLEAAISSLDPASREVLVLRDVEGLTAAQVAEVTGASVDAVKSRLHRARAEVRAKVAESPRAVLDASSPCPDVVTLYSRYLEGEIGAPECARMQEHLTRCARCDAACASLRRTVGLCRAAASAPIPLDVQQLVREALRRASEPRRA